VILLGNNHLLAGYRTEKGETKKKRKSGVPDSLKGAGSGGPANTSSG